jgi:hypothetical protein
MIKSQNKKQLGILGTIIFCTVVQLLVFFVLVSDVRIRFTLIELMLLVVNPLVIFYLRNNWPRRIWIKSFLIILIVWFFTLPFFHELSHVIGVYIIGEKPTAYQLIPKFWKGDFTTAWVRSDAVNDWRGSIPGLFPYFKDIFLLIIGFIIVKIRKVSNAFWAGFIYAFFCLGSMFDIINNYLQKLLGYVVGNDFYGVSLGWGDIWSNIIGIAFSSLAIFICVWVQVHYRPYNVSKNKL